MRKLLILLMLICSPCYATDGVDVLPNLTDENSTTVLNDNLQRMSARMRTLSANVGALIPSQSGHAGQYLTTDGSAVSWQAITSIPQGVIVMWSGNISSIPSGWELSDGTCSITCPDLRDRFIVGAYQDDAGVAKTNVTGSLTQSGDGTIPSHTHSYNAASTPGPALISSGGDYNPTSVSAGTTGAYGSGVKNIAVYYALAYIIKT